jgi:hypothetical protein
MGKEREFQVGMETARLGAAAGEAEKGRAFQREERLGTQEFVKAESDLERQLKADIEAGKITHDEAMRKLDRQLTRDVEAGRISAEEKQATLDRALQIKLKEMPSRSIVEHISSEDDAKWGGLATQILEEADAIWNRLSEYKNSKAFNEAFQIKGFDTLDNDQYEYLKNHQEEFFKYAKWQLTEHYVGLLQGDEQASAGEYFNNRLFLAEPNWDLRTSTDGDKRKQTNIEKSLQASFEGFLDSMKVLLGRKERPPLLKRNRPNMPEELEGTEEWNQ